jgi:hypothetical protein
MSLTGVLLVVFIVLKLVGVITWSWWLVFLPAYFGIAFILILLLAMALGLSFAVGMVSVLNKLKIVKK